METPFPPFEPEEPADADDKPDGHPTRLRDIPLRMLVPNLITLAAICSGLTAIRLATEERYYLAIVAILFAAILDALDGRAARYLNATTRFGAQMDSLADFLNFGVAPALVLHIWLLHDIKSIGWIAALTYAICGCLRLARFNVTLDDPNRPTWMTDFFTGVPAPAGALLVLLPVYVGFLGVEPGTGYAAVATLYTMLVGLLMVSTLPTFSGKNVGQQVPRKAVLPLMICAVIGVGILFSYPWFTLTVICLGYIATLPFSYALYRRRLKGDVD
jgi:CDP-diacylglycerol--serine O-phosphatidyltransferase